MVQVCQNFENFDEAPSQTRQYHQYHKDTRNLTFQGTKTNKKRDIDLSEHSGYSAKKSIINSVQKIDENQYLQMILHKFGPKNGTKRFIAQLQVKDKVHQVRIVLKSKVFQFWLLKEKQSCLFSLFNRPLCSFKIKHFEKIELSQNQFHCWKQITIETKLRKFEISFEQEAETC